MKLMSMEKYKKSLATAQDSQSSSPAYSKYAIFKWLTRQNLWKEFKQWLESAGLTDYWDIPTQFSDEDEDFQKGVEAFKARFKLSDDQINTMKEECRI